MASGLQQVRLDAGYLGQDVDSAPAAMGRAKALLIENYLTGDQGRLKQRGALTDAAIAIAVTNGRIAGMLRGKDKLLIGFRKNNDGTKIVEPWRAPYKPSATGDLAISLNGATDGKLVDLAAATVADHDFAPEGVPGPRVTNYGKFAYGIGYSSPTDNTFLTNALGGSEHKRRLLRYDATGSTTPTTYTSAPYGAQDLRIHYGRLLVLGGTDPSVSADVTLRRNRVYHTQALTANDHDSGINSTNHSAPPLAGGAAVADAEAIWRDEESGALNKLDLPGYELDFGVAFATAGRHLAILKRHEIVLLTGYGPESWQLRQFAQGIGCLDPRSVVEANDGCYFLSEQGFMFFDGVQLQDASKGVHASLLAAGLAAVGDTGVAGGFAIGERLTNDYILLTIGQEEFNTSTNTVTFCGLYHIPSASWANFTSRNFATTGTAPSRAIRTENRVALLDHSNLYLGTNVTTPENIAEASRGKDEAGTNDNNIVTKWHSRTVELASPFNKATLQRVIVDYVWIVDGGTEDQFVGPTVTVKDGQGNTIGSTWTLPSGADSGLEIPRKRFVKDIFEEISELQVRIEYTANAAPGIALVKSEILDVFIEYQPAYERR